MKRSVLQRNTKIIRNDLSGGDSQLGEVKAFPLKDWDDFDRLPIPDVNDAAPPSESEENPPPPDDMLVGTDNMALPSEPPAVQGQP